MICFLSSDYGRHVCGQIVGVDGNIETLYPRSKSSNPRVGIVFADRLLLGEQACGSVHSLQPGTRLRDT